MNILLTHGYFLEEDEKEKLIMKPYVPLGILYISAWLSRNGFENEVFDSTFSSFEKLKTKLTEKRPEILGIYVNLMTKLNVLRIMEFIRNTPALSHTRIVLGGPEVKNHVANFMNHGADIIVLGEGEESMAEIAAAFSKSADPDLSGIAGIAWKNKSGETIMNEPRQLLKEVDALPFPDRSKIDLHLYLDAWKKHHGQSTISVSTMRGCPYTCKWCSRAVYGLSYRRRSPELVADEMEHIREKYKPDMIWFVDDVFTISHKWLREFADEIEKRKLELPYEIITRADRMNEEVIDLLVKSGCRRVWIGAESGSQKIIDAMDRRVDVKQVSDMIRLSQQKGIQAGTFIMLGYPGETQKDIRETIRHLVSSDPDLYTITVAYPIKGTPLYEEVESRFIQQPDWAKSTDRDIDFERSFPRKYYDYAVRWVYNEVAFSKSRKNGHWMKMPIHKLKSLAARGGMFLSKMM
ncbi:MAG: radical SAM protein [Bacteroidetes bacterium]|nr:MAG: radical SAM protein [Bacteroidota bacterium]